MSAADWPVHVERAYSLAELPPSVAGNICERGDCWVWVGSRNRAGYGACRGSTAHRVVWQLLVEKLPAYLELDHCVCLDRACVHPRHLQPVTHRENIALGRERRTHCRKGHPFAGDNLYIYPEGSPQAGTRRCNECLAEAAAADLERKRLRRAMQPKAPRVLATHCRQGHEYAVVGVYTYPATSRQAGVRRCLACYEAANACR